MATPSFQYQQASMVGRTNEAPTFLAIPDTVAELRRAVSELLALSETVRGVPAKPTEATCGQLPGPPCLAEVLRDLPPCLSGAAGMIRGTVLELYDALGIAPPAPRGEC